MCTILGVDQSIEGQLRVCNEYALLKAIVLSVSISIVQSSVDLTIVRFFNVQFVMLQRNSSMLFIVWKLDCFAYNR